jgi:hypothetical protein
LKGISNNKHALLTLKEEIKFPGRALCILRKIYFNVRKCKNYRSFLLGDREESD